MQALHSLDFQLKIRGSCYFDYWLMIQRQSMLFKQFKWSSDVHQSLYSQLLSLFLKHQDILQSIAQWLKFVRTLDLKAQLLHCCIHLTTGVSILSSGSSLSIYLWNLKLHWILWMWILCAIALHSIFFKIKSWLILLTATQPLPPIFYIAY